MHFPNGVYWGRADAFTLLDATAFRYAVSFAFCHVYPVSFDFCRAYPVCDGIN